MCSLSLMLLTLGGKEYVPWYYAVLMVFGAVRSFINPVLQSLLPQIVPRAKLPQSLATNSTLMKIATILGPVSGGLLYGVGGGFSYLVCAGFFLLALLPLPKVKLLYARQEKVLERFSVSTVWARFREGGRFIWSQPIVLGAISLDLFAVLLGGVVALLPIYAAEVLHVGAEGLGLLRSAMAVGEVATGLYLTRFPICKAVGKTMFAAVALFGAANLVFALSSSFWLSFAALAFAGACDMVSVNIRGSLIQLATPDHLRGRVSAVNMLFISSSNELGEFRAGLSARWLGAVPTAVAGSLFTLGVVGWIMYRFVPLRRVDNFDEAVAQAGKPTRGV
nr:MFS transporter [Neisseria perflava]